MTQRILCDDRVVFAAEALGPLGILDCRPAASIDAAALRHADILVIRSTTKVDDALLEGSAIRFVATATVGTDHVDEAALERRGIGFASAARSSAASVAEYTWGLLLTACARQGRDWRTLRLGVVGAGAIGERVARVGEALGLPAVRRIDPPRRAREGATSRCEGHEARRECDLLSLHLPLTTTGPEATDGLIDAAWLHALPEDALLINTGRGATLDSGALAAAGPRIHAALDVWAGEPDLGAAVDTGARLLSPHVAGRSREGMAANTRAVREALSEYLGQTGGEIPNILAPTLDLDPDADPRELVDAAWKLDDLDAALRAGRSDPEAFSRLRDRCARRHDLTAHRVLGGGEEVENFLSALRSGVTELS